MTDQPTPRNLSRRKALFGIGAAGITLTCSSAEALAQGAGLPEEKAVSLHLTISSLRTQTALREGEWVKTVGFHTPGDGGAALYQIRKAEGDLTPNDADVVALPGGLLAVLMERVAVNYRMFGAIGDGANDDGVQIMLAHEYANRNKVPVINLSGEFWITRTVGIPISTPVQWGQTTLHIDERFNSRRTPRFVVLNDQPTVSLVQDEALKAALLKQLKPGVQIIPELAPHAGHLFVVRDEDDRIGIRSGYAGNRGWAREELFYVEEEGRIIGDIAWEFKNLTSISAKPCSRDYLVIQGGGFHYSGDTPEGARGSSYYQHGILVQRSRTIIREQWMGLERGRKDASTNPRSGFYVMQEVYDVTLEDIRAMPWEKERRPPKPKVPEGTYGIGGARMLNCTFRNLTAEAGWVSWGVFGTNLNKNFRLENCRLNRVDVHFHCWNLHISNCTIGFKGISVTGGGELLVENTTRHGNTFISFRPDYGARWDGPIRLRGCTLKPSGNGRVAVLSMQPSDFDYKYPLGLGTSVSIEDLRIDFSAAPESKEPCWLMSIPAFSVNQHGQRLFFPERLVFRDIAVVGREQGVRLIRIPDPWHYVLPRAGGCDNGRLRPNCTLVCERVQLEKTIPAAPGDTKLVHLLIGGASGAEDVDSQGLFPRIVFEDCENVALHLGQCAASVFMQRCSVNTVTALGLRGELSFNECRLQPEVLQPGEVFYAVESSLGTRFTNCTIHAPIVSGKDDPNLVDRVGFLEINGVVRHYHLNTALGNEVLESLKDKGIKLSAGFIGKLKCHHALEE